MHDSTSVAFYFIALVLVGKLFCGLLYVSALGIAHARKARRKQRERC